MLKVTCRYATIDFTIPKWIKRNVKRTKLAAISTVVGSEAASGFLSLIDAGQSKIDKYSNALKIQMGQVKSI